MSSTLLPGPRATAVLLVVAPLCELVEARLSPLPGSSTSADLDAIAAHPGAFQASVMFGLLATALYVPAFLGLAQACFTRSPRLARLAGWTTVASMGGFLGVRMAQAVELAGVRDGLDHHQFGAVVDHAASNPVGASLLVAFLGGALIGLALLAVIAGRAGLPKAPCVLLAVFQLVDFATPQHPVPYAHLLLLVALCWLAAALWSRGGASRQADVVAVPATA